MAWSFTDLRYGWKIATGIALASTTIYVANNTRWRVNQADVIELALGVDERIMALQTGTNAFGAPVYPVARLSFVRNWITNNYETQVVGGVTSVVAVAYTNTVTNTIGYRTDHAMMVELDTKLKTIVPYYVDTNTFLPLTFTGLLASLNLGDGTNFTRTPAIGTNAATYGELPWRIYVQDLQERYKVLNALKMTVADMTWSDKGETGMAWAVSSGDPNWWDFLLYTWQQVKDQCISNGVNYGSYQYNWWETEHPYHYTQGRSRHAYGADDAMNFAGCFSSYKYPKITVASDIEADCLIYVYAHILPYSRYTNYNGSVHISNWEWVSDYPANAWHFIEKLSTLTNGINYGSKVGDNIIDFDFPSQPHTDWFGDTNYLTDSFKGWLLTDKKAFFVWQFSYCTNKYW